MKAFINACGTADSLREDRLGVIRGLIQFGGKTVVQHTLDRLAEIKVEPPVIILTEPEHKTYYEQALRNRRHLVSVVEYTGIANPLAAYFTGLQLARESDHVLMLADDNLFDFSLEGLVRRLKKVDDNVLTIRKASRIGAASDVQGLNFGTCLTDKKGKVIRGSYSFNPQTHIDSQNIILDLYLIHQKRIPFFTGLLNENGSLEKASEVWYQDFHAWEPKDGFWADIGKPTLRKSAEKYFLAK